MSNLRLVLNYKFNAWSVCGVERLHLFVGEALLSEDLKQWGSVAVPSLEHLPDNRQKVPDTLRLSAPQRTQETCPLSSSRGFSGRQVHGVNITANSTSGFSQITNVWKEVR